MGKSVKKNLGKIGGLMIGDVPGALIGSAYDNKKSKDNKKKNDYATTLKNDEAENINNANVDSEYINSINQRKKATQNQSYTAVGQLKSTFGG